jgi:hypothetical protein
MLGTVIPPKARAVDRAVMDVAIAREGKSPLN